MDQPQNSAQSAPRDGRSFTALETDEEIRRALLPEMMENLPESAVEPPSVAEPGQPDGRPVSPYRPTARPPVPILTVFDDGRSDGEAIRIRQPRFIIGRTEGDLRFPLDGRMSSKHVEITLQAVGGLHRWVVTDLQSTHGTFVRVSRSALADRAEFLVGNGRYRFEAARAERDATIDHVPGGGSSGRTRGLDDEAAAFRPAALSELIGSDIGNRVLLVKDEYWIGTSQSCQVCRPDDPFCEARHARLHRGPRGQWSVEHDRTRNGLWVKIAQIAAESMVYFQAGEQRFKLKVG